MQQCRTSHRQIGNAPGVHEVTKIDHALKLPMTLSITLPHHVVVGDVHMHCLPRQVIGQGADTLFDLLGHLLQCRAVRKIVQRRQQMRDQSLRVAWVPLQRAVQSRMLEPRQRLAHAPTQVTKSGDHPAPQVRQMGQRLAIDIIEYSYMQGLAVEGQGQQLLSCQRLDDLGYAYSLQAIECGVLGVQFNGSVVTSTDFQNKPTARAVDFVVEVLLAAQ